MNILHTPIDDGQISKLNIGDVAYISGDILCGRDAVLPKIVDLYENGRINELGVDLEGGLIFHTAVSPAGIGPTSSNKAEIEASMITLSKAGIRIHLGKGRIGEETIRGLSSLGAMFAVVPPVTALLGSRVRNSELVAYPELGMEALYKLAVVELPIIIAASNGRSIYDGS